MTLLVFRTVHFPQVSFDCIVNNVPNDLLYSAYSLEHQKCHIWLLLQPGFLAPLPVFTTKAEFQYNSNVIKVY